MRSHLWLAAVIPVLVLSSLGSPSAAPARPQAPDFELADLAGKPVRLSGLRGAVVVLHFWATWCPECVEELPSLNAFADRFRGRNVTILSVSVDRSESALKAFLAEHPLRFPVLLDPDGDVFVSRYRTRALPATVVIDRQGAVAARLPGRQDFLSRGFRNRIEELIEGRKPQE